MAEHNQQFDDFTQWVNKASSWLTRHPDYNEKCFKAICFDAKGRHCKMGGDFMRARDENTFPVRWLWPDQIGEIVLGRDECVRAIQFALQITNPTYMRDFLSAWNEGCEAEEWPEYKDWSPS